MPLDHESHAPDIAELRQLQRMETAGQLAGGLAHEFNNLLQGIGGSLQLVRRRAAQGRTEDVERLAGAGMVALERAVALTRRMHDFARRQPQPPAPVDVNRVADEVAVLARLVAGRAMPVDTDLQAAPGAILCDSGQLEAVLLGLCLNAREAMPHGGRLVIGTADATTPHATGEHVTLRVADTGAGMTPEALARAREPLSDSVFADAGPPGRAALLRLSSLHGFARGSGGHADIDSVPGAGTIVTLWLPRRREAAARQSR